MRDLLLEIGCENLPPHAIQPAFEQLRADAARRFEELRLPFDEIYASGGPRRLVLIVRGLAPVQTAKTEVVTGPPVSKAYDDNGEPTLTAAGFARSHGVTVADLESVRTDRGEYVGFAKKLPRGRTGALLKTLLPELVVGLRFPKVMRWEASGVRFARPIRWILCLFGETVVPFSIAGVRSGAVTHVEPWLKPGRFKVRDAGHYLALHQKAGIVVDHRDRLRRIESLAASAARKHSAVVIDDPGLMREITFMLESPHVFVGDFERRYLTLPPEVVTTAMKAHQRYIALRSKGGKLVPKFVGFTEGKPADASLVRRGNERVLRARLEDALFYWNEDLKTGVEGLSRRLENIVFIEGLGSLKDKAARLDTLGRLVNEMAAPDDRVPDEAIRRGALLAKADLASEMVKDGKEFTLLEGLIGSHYAREGNESEDVVAAIREHYLPRSPSDPLPRTALGTIFGIADRIDTVSGCFLANLIPTGSQDPYALRRQAMGLVRILERRRGVRIDPLIQASVSAYVDMGLSGKQDPAEAVARIEDFFRARTETFLREKGIAQDAVAAVAAVSWAAPGLALGMARAVERLRGDRSFELLITGVKRVGNILPKEMKRYGVPWGVIEEMWLRNGTHGPVRFEARRFEDEAEHALHEAVRRALPTLEESEADADFGSVFAALAALGPVIDRYFDRVLVNSPDPALRANRQQFLAAVFALFSRYADFSRIVEESKTASG